MAETRPNDLPDMLLGETRFVSFNWATGAGANSLTDVAFNAIPAHVDFTTPSTDGLEATVFVTPAQAGLYRLYAVGTLSSGEIISLPARVKVTDPASCSDEREYR